MEVKHYSCSPAVNESEQLAFEQLKSRLRGANGAGEWVILTNLAFTTNQHLQSDEIDAVVIGPPGVRVVEVKHWTAAWVDSNNDLVGHEADKVTNKARKIGSTLRRIVPNLPRVDGTILLTQDPTKVKRLTSKEIRGVCFHTLQEWKQAINFDSPNVLTALQISKLAQALEPKVAVTLDGSLRRLAGYVNLELQTPKQEGFHRVYKGVHSARQDRVILHLYDLSASDDKNAENKARREFESLHRVQLRSWAPRILDSFREVPGYAAEMYYFTLVDPAAPSLEERAADFTWGPTERISFARNAVRALAELHETCRPGDESVIHRNLNRQTILVKHDNTPILTGFDRAKLPSEQSVTSGARPLQNWDEAMAPEVRREGLFVASRSSDVYSMCSSLSLVFQDSVDDASRRAVAALGKGMTEASEDRCSLKEIDTALTSLLGESVPPPPPPPARYWTEDQVIRFHDHDYRIVTRLGSGEIGHAFKVVELDRQTHEELGTYVAKVVHDAVTGRQILRSYGLARSHLGRHNGLSAIFEVAREWRENEFLALLTWVEGTPFGEFAGVFPLLAEEQQEPTFEALATHWLRSTCESLDVFHRNGLVHGDISPRNIIVSGGDLVLTDYDFVRKTDEDIISPGTLSYCSPQEGGNTERKARASDDIYALASTFFYVVFGIEPFQHNGETNKRGGLNWQDIETETCPMLKAFLDRATHVDHTKRFLSAADALVFLREVPKTLQMKPAHAAMQASQGTGLVIASREKHIDSNPDGEITSPVTEPGSKTKDTLREEHIDWLLPLLQSYPGSPRWGNRETRGLDSDFAARTYVETRLEEVLFQDIRNRRTRLVILCGNAGDGKTALLQHLAVRFGLGKHSSAERTLKGKLPNGPTIRMNLDGSAAWRGRSSDQLLDEFFQPFQNGVPHEDIAHLIAINDGRLLEWIDGTEERHGNKPTPLTLDLADLLREDRPKTHQSHIRFVSLNARSLVGGVSTDGTKLDLGFLDRLLDQLYGGERAAEIWRPCQSCTAQDRCEVFRATQLFGPEGVPGLSPAHRARARQRLYESLQAVHLRGETHITMRELRAAIVFVLFGIHHCTDYHESPDLTPTTFWDRAFDPVSPGRQGEVLRELARFDPGLEAYPPIDRHLLSSPASDSPKTAPHYETLSLESARRRAFFEWTAEDAEQITGDPNALDLARGRHLSQFRDLALQSESGNLDRLCERICTGISRLEDLPPQAYSRTGVVPLRVTPRTPTETAFWVEKPLSSFRLIADLPADRSTAECLHRQAFLLYRYRNGGEERLRLGAELFHLLLELGDGYQLGDVSTDDTFANLSIFVQRLVREDERTLIAWSPMSDEKLFQVTARKDETSEGPRQRLALTVLKNGGGA